MTQIYNYFWGFRNTQLRVLNMFNTWLFPSSRRCNVRPGTLALPPSSEKSGTLIPVLPDNDAPWPIEPIMATWLWVIIVTWKHPETKVSQLHLPKIQYRVTREKYPSQKETNCLPSESFRGGPVISGSSMKNSIIYPVSNIWLKEKKTVSYRSYPNHLFCGAPLSWTEALWNHLKPSV